MALSNLTVTPPAKHRMSDVADLAGVSVKTVSRVLNNEPGVQESTRRRVLQVMEELGYQPHSGARSLRGRAPNCVGITLGAPARDVPLSEELLAWIFRQLYLVFGAAGNYVCFDLNPYGTGKGGDYARGLWERLYRCVVVTGPLALDDCVMARIHASGYPYLCLGRLPSLPELSHATVDFEQATYLATRHLLERGHKRIALLMGLEGYSPSLERRQGYLRAFEEAGVAPCLDLIEPVRFTSGDLVRGVQRLLTGAEVTALIDSSGAEDGRSLREGFRRAGRSLGNDVELVAWTYSCDAAVVLEAQAHVWVPIHDALLAGLKELSDWLEGSRREPVRVLHRPVLQCGPLSHELQKPRQLFTTRD